MKKVSDILISDGTKFHSLRSNKIASDKYVTLSSGSGVSDGTEFYVLMRPSTTIAVATLTLSLSNPIDHIPQISFDLNGNADEQYLTVVIEIYENSEPVGTKSFARASSSIKYTGYDGKEYPFKQGVEYKAKVIKVGDIDGNVGPTGLLYEDSNAISTPILDKVELIVLDTTAKELTLSFAVRYPDGVIDWGDGTTSDLEVSGGERYPTPYSHTYSTGGHHIVKLIAYLDSIFVFSAVNMRIWSATIHPEIYSPIPSWNIVINLSDNAITSFTCPEYIKKLHLNKNTYLETLDLSAVTTIETLYLNNTSLASLDVSKQSNLIELNVDNTPIRSFSTSNNPELKELHITGSNIWTMDLSNNGKLKKFYSDNSKLSTLTLPKGSFALTYITIAATPINEYPDVLNSLIDQVPLNTSGNMWIHELKYTRDELMAFGNRLETGRGWELKVRRYN